ncbi:hypothetical protein JZ751_025738 [Albula glossodonta]|uniref:Uncharacterized protein n=1 Tax=Albula glossodonta TaxID=121402 RepID=A0A8T2NDF3_9TELE|nr:hypothetical protein JZ751_025738 [Albula glossodonta]
MAIRVIQFYDHVSWKDTVLQPLFMELGQVWFSTPGHERLALECHRFSYSRFEVMTLPENDDTFQ